jgi:hypothetical protein
MLLLVKYFVSSNSSHSSLENIYLRKLLNKIVGTKSFDDKILPEIYEKLRTKIKEKLEKAEDVCLMSDIWTNMQNSDFIAIVMGLMNANFKREVLVADMMRVPGDSHTAENIKIAIETMVKISLLLQILIFFKYY